MQLVCFDTQIIIWGVKNQATPGQEENIDKAKLLIRICEDNGSRVMVPSVVVAELLCALAPELHNSFSEQMHRQFIVPLLDTQAALHFANLWKNRQNQRPLTGISRSEMKADFMIISIALARGANCIYSEDSGLRNFAQQYIDVKPLPDL